MMRAVPLAQHAHLAAAPCGHAVLCQPWNDRFHRRCHVTAPFGPKTRAVGSFNRWFVPGLGLTANTTLGGCGTATTLGITLGFLEECRFGGKPRGTCRLRNAWSAAAATLCSPGPAEPAPSGFPAAPRSCRCRARGCTSSTALAAPKPFSVGKQQEKKSWRLAR